MLVKPSELNSIASKKQKSVKHFFQKLRNLKPQQIDNLFHEMHHDVFKGIDCLRCANCCKTISPVLYNIDIERLSKALKIKTSRLIEEYLTRDEDNDYVFKTSPCPFLDSDNYCKVYHNRPKACREYPHTNRKRMYQILDLTYKNYFICPAVFEIIERLEKA